MEKNHHKSFRCLLKSRITPQDVTVDQNMKYLQTPSSNPGCFLLLPALFFGHISVIVCECKRSRMSPFIFILMESLKLSASPINSQPARKAAAAAVYMISALPVPTLPFPTLPFLCG